MRKYIDTTSESIKNINLFIYEEKKYKIIEKINISDKNLFEFLVKYISFLNSTWENKKEIQSKKQKFEDLENNKVSLYMMINYLIDYPNSK